MAASIKYRCPECHATTSVTPKNKYRKHANADGDDCRMSGEFVPPRVMIEYQDDGDDKPKRGRDYDVCPMCDRSPRLDVQGAFRPHVTKQGGTEECLMSGKLPNGKRPASLDDPIPMNGGEQQSFSEGQTVVCPNPDCGRKKVEVQSDGTLGPHMRVEWGDKVCPMSYHNPSEWPLPEVSPKSVPILDGTETDSAPPTPADVPDTPIPDIPEADTSETPEIQDASPDVPNDAPTPIVPRTEDIPRVWTDSRGPNSSERCVYCDAQLGGNHTCYPRFVPAGVSCDPMECVSGGHVGDPACEFHTPSQFQPAGAPPRYVDSVIPMDTMAERLAAQFKEIFYAYSNRMDRTIQETLGPSEIGTPCDRRLAMSLLQISPVNPGGDNWASFVGTCVHSGLAEMFEWADAHQGRFAVEVPLEYPSKLVPHGTSDLLDRTAFMVDDHKLMGRWSLDKLRLEGIKPLYRVQLHVYGYGQKLKGEKIKYVALIGWPREQATLDDLYVVVEPYDESIALGAFKRVEEINHRVIEARAAGHEPLAIARTFDVQNDCRFCPFYAKGDSMMERGCNGKR